MSRANDPYDPCAGEASGEPGCARPTLERLRFWNGRFLVARDLRDQQDDLVRRLEYHQHFAHGSGILCGFRLREHPRDDCERDWVVVDGGMAYDCCGRTLWMPEPRAVRIPRPAAPAGEAPPGGAEPGGAEPPQPPLAAPGEPGQARDAADDPRDRQADDGHGGHGHHHDHPDHHDDHGHGHHGAGSGEDPVMPEPQFFLVARRKDRPADPMPALYADDLGEPVRQEYGRIREEVEIEVVPAAAVSQGCWPRPSPVTPEDCTRGLDDDCEGEAGDTVPCGLGCACGDQVVLAGLWRDARGVLRWDLTHRKVLIPPSELTRITGVNWPHGGEVRLGHLRKQMNGQLIVRFSRRLRPAEGDRRGINPMTFELSYLGESGTWKQVMPDPGDPGERNPTLSSNRRCAVFQIPRDLLDGRYSLAGTTVRVRVLGDFLLDCHRRPVSAAHTGGDVNGRGSGNGVPGGTFESWFYVRNSWKEDDR